MTQRPVIRIHYSTFVCSVLKAKNDGELNFIINYYIFKYSNALGRK